MVYKDPPSGAKCEKCGSDILVKQSNTYTKEYCANPNCDYSKIIKKGQTD
jgi:ssDNA-binding Zn-finger/Zn-ribbon topoisomerase 1